MSEADRAAERRRELSDPRASAYAAPAGALRHACDRPRAGALQNVHLGVQAVHARVRAVQWATRPRGCRPTRDKGTMRDAFHEDLDSHLRPAGRDDPAGRLGDEPGHDGAARRRHPPRRVRDRRRRADRRRCARSSTTARSTCWPASSRWPPTCGWSSPSMRMSADLERMGDLARHVAKVARLRYPAVRHPRRGCARRSCRWARWPSGSSPRPARSSPARTSRPPSRSSATTTRWTGLHRELFNMLLDDTWTHGTEAAVDMTLRRPLLRAVRRPRRVASPAASSTWSPASGTPRPSSTARSDLVPELTRPDRHGEVHVAIPVSRR